MFGQTFARYFCRSLPYERFQLRQGKPMQLCLAGQARDIQLDHLVLNQ